MTGSNALRTRPSLLERAAEIYDFSSGRLVAQPPELEPVASPPPEPEAVPVAPPVKVDRELRRAAPPSGRRVTIDRERLRSGGFILPDAPVTGLAEELRLIKRQLLLSASGKTGIAEDKRRRILVCSAQPDEGKTFCALNLALSLSSERDLEVLLVDGDFPKPEILSLLGVEGGPGLVDALADPGADLEAFVVRTDLGGLSLLPAGRKANNVPELLASERTSEVLAALTDRNPRRIIIFDSPPALMASPASVLASHVGQALVVVRADRTTESDLKETVDLLSACDRVGLVLNGAGFAASGRRFGHYYGYEQCS
ncbi:AAA family ATPase [Allosphingosinicella sp.]|jgi:exopolysaccharide/PEP-CTERM locus tyrosine autokinase|uniref:AAA family ATPase n=1 Tax=Allosphingosinicella sp. TaxID=2823234 RepID=UPI002F1A75EA